eukprot:21582-Chlamydomonas_euryale.AAC.1
MDARLTGRDHAPGAVPPSACTGQRTGSACMHIGASDSHSKGSGRLMPPPGPSVIGLWPTGGCACAAAVTPAGAAV